MKAIFPAICGALLLATSLPAAAAQDARFNPFGALKSPASSVSQFGSAKAGSTIQAGRIESSPQLVDRQAISQVGRTGEYQSINQYKVKAGSAYAAPRPSSTLSRPSMNWGSASIFSLRPNLKH